MVDVTLTAGQRRVLEHVRLFRITTQDVLERLYFRGREKNVKSFLQRLRKRGFLDFAPLTSRRNYYHLTQRGLQLLGAPDLRAGPLKGDSLVERYGILEFCSRRPGARQKLSKEDFATRFPQLAPRNMPGTCYYVDAEEEPRRYGWVYVHRSAPAWRVQTRVVQNILGRRYAHEETSCSRQRCSLAWRSWEGGGLATCFELCWKPGSGLRRTLARGSSLLFPGRVALRPGSDTGSHAMPSPLRFAAGRASPWPGAWCRQSGLRATTCAIKIKTP